MTGCWVAVIIAVAGVLLLLHCATIPSINNRNAVCCDGAWFYRYGCYFCAMHDGNTVAIAVAVTATVTFTAAFTVLTVVKKAVAEAEAGTGKGVALLLPLRLRTLLLRLR